MKTIAAGLAALVVTVSSPLLAQSPTVGATDRLSGAAERLSQGDASALTDVRVAVIKSTLQLTPDQEKLWPPIEDAIRTRAQNRESRIASTIGLAEERRERGIVDTMRNRNPIDFIHRRAEALSQRADDLNRLADAWQPLYRTLTPDQKRRMGALAILVLRDMRSVAEDRRLQNEDESEQEN